MIELSKKTKRTILYYKLSRYECHLIVQNGEVKNFDKFHNAGYRDLYNGETADDIFKRKKISSCTK